MNGAPVRRAVRATISRRRVQTIVIGAVALVSAAASVLGLALAADSNAPFDKSFAAQHGADLTATFSTAKASRAAIAATRRLAGVTAAAGPFAEATVTLSVAGPGGTVMTQLTVTGRRSPGGPVDDISLQAGHWATGPGQIVLPGPDSQAANATNLPQSLRPGDRVTVDSAPGKPQLTVVGLATSVTGSADGWVAPAEIGQLTALGGDAPAQMLYRFAKASTAAQVKADTSAIKASLPAGAVTATLSYLTVRLQEESGIGPIAPFIAAFGVIGLVLAVLIVVNVVGGAVVAGYTRIGILKSIGFTPGQVTLAYVWQAMLPAVVGGVAGLVLANLEAGALLNRAATVYQVGRLGVPGWVNLSVAGAILVLVGTAAAVPAARAGRLSAIEAITAGRAPHRSTGRRAHRLLARLRLSRPVTLGLAVPFARPARTATTLIAVLLGAGSVIFAAGLGISLTRIVSGLRLSDTVQASVQLPTAGPGPGGVQVQGNPPAGRQSAVGPLGHRGKSSPGLEQQAVKAALRGQPGTLHYIAETDQLVTIPGQSRQVPITAYRGNSRWLGYQMISGRWYDGPDQVDVPTYFLSVTGKSVGDTLTFSLAGHQVTARIVGEVFSSDNNGLAIFTSWQTLANADLKLAQPDQFDIGLLPGTSMNTYVQELSNRLGPAYSVSPNGATRGLPLVLSLISLLTLLLALVAGLGVLNTVLLQTRERVHDLGVLKSVGMTPRQVIVMVVAWVAGTGLVAGVLAVPAGLALHGALLPVVARAAGTALPADVLNVYGRPLLAALALAGLAIAVAGALAPATWAAVARPASALRAE